MSQILNVCSYFGRLAELALSSNQLSILPELPNEPRIAETLTTVHVSSNYFAAISDLRPLADLPNLSKLVANHCKIRSVSSGPQQIVFSKTLTHVELAFNDITDWEFVDRLPDVFVGLEQLRISHNPLFQQLRAANGRPLSEDDGYMLTVAHLGTLLVLNYSPVCGVSVLHSYSYKTRLRRRIEKTRSFTIYPKLGRRCP
jgi:tubulin-specific chaperone E